MVNKSANMEKQCMKILFELQSRNCASFSSKIAALTSLYRYNKGGGGEDTNVTGKSDEKNCASLQRPVDYAYRLHI